VTALDRFLIRRGFDDPPTQIMLLALLPFAVYLVANQFDLSGILAAVSVGVTPKRRNRYLASG
jgi:monovalent cation/hydrogen antiporter